MMGSKGVGLEVGVERETDREINYLRCWWDWMQSLNRVCRVNGGFGKKKMMRFLFGIVLSEACGMIL